MANLIKILPDSLANQIAAGEVIQRPASVIKELVENAIDAQATEIIINIKDAGKTLIQVIDNGIGMSADDARLAFERHATSKISTSDDLFAISTKGFRGEALASIAAVAKVELKTKTHDDNIGTFVQIEGSNIINIEAVNCPAGTNFAVKNLFFNVPARRKFLKSDKTEFQHILTELYRIAIPHHKVAFTLYHNENIVHKLIPGTLKERLVSIFDKSLSKQLVDIQADANFIKIHGYVGHPEYASKTSPKQYFFVNNRFMKSGYFHKAVMMAYDKLILQEQKPNYFIFFEIDPSRIDVNIHPTKTEINFDNANGIFQVLLSTIRKALTDFDIPPAIDFDNTEFINIPEKNLDEIEHIPQVTVNPTYNPFDKMGQEISMHSKISQNASIPFVNDDFDNDIFSNSSNKQKPSNRNENLLIFKNKYILTPAKSGIMVIHINRALKQIKYEEILTKISTEKTSIETIYPIPLNLSSIEVLDFKEIRQELESLGFKFEQINETAFNIIATPPYIKPDTSPDLIKKLTSQTHLSDTNIKKFGIEEIATYILENEGHTISQLNKIEAESIINKLFSCASHKYTFEGKTIISMIETDEIDKLF